MLQRLMPYLGESIYGEKFADEFDNGVIAHTEPYLLSMVCFYAIRDYG